MKKAQTHVKISMRILALTYVGKYKRALGKNKTKHICNFLLYFESAK